MSIVTKTGDNGTTGLWGGNRVSKKDDLIEAIGNLDELNSALGIIRSESVDQTFDPILEFIQNRCFVIGAEIASVQAEIFVRDQNIPKLAKSDIEKIELEISDLEKNLPELKNFILPYGSKISCWLFFARAICRRAERSVVRLQSEKLTLDQNFLNRLSDLLFLFARASNQEREVIWAGRKNKY